MTATMITITAKEYNRLLKAEMFLSRLEAAGVDNWEGYCEACCSDDDDEEGE